MKDNTDREEKIIVEDVSLGQKENNPNKNKSKKIDKKRFVIITVLVFVGLALLLKPVLRDSFLNNNIEETGLNDKPVYKNKGLEELRGWGELTQEERENYIDKNPSIKGKTWAQTEVTYANRKYLNRFGKEEFEKYDKAERDQLYKESVVQEAICFQFGEDVELMARLNGLSLQEKIDFLESNYQTGNAKYNSQLGDFDSRTYNLEDFDWYVIEDYSIPIPNTMYLSNDTSFGIKYNFMQKDPSKYARIQVKFDYDDYSFFASYFNNGRKLPLMEETSVSIEIWQGMKEMGFEVLNLKGPDYINIDGEIVMKVGFDRKDPFPTHVDIYSFYLSNKCTTITTSYRVADAKEWKSIIEASIKGIKRKNN